MKKSEILISISVFCTFFVIGCLKVGGERSAESMGLSGPGAPVTIYREEKAIRAAVSSLHERYEIRFYVRSTTPFAYKLKVDERGDIEVLVEDLERLELDGEKYWGILNSKAKQSSFNRKLREKLKAIRDFLDNYSTDSSYFLGIKCPKISGIYKKNDIDEQEEFISIKSRGCRIFEVSRNKKLKGPVIKLEAIRNCRGGRDYWLCSQGSKMPSNHIEFLFVEKWDQENCMKENWLRVDEKGGTLISKVRQSCKGANVAVFEDKFFKVTAAD